MTTSTATRDDLVAMATFPLTRPGENTVPAPSYDAVRGQVQAERRMKARRITSSTTPRP
jgi:hypothetical protein